MNNIIKVFNKTISQQKQKSHNRKISDSIVYKVFYNKDKKMLKLVPYFQPY